MAIQQFKSRRKAKRLLYSPVAIIVLGLVVVLLARATWSIHEKYDLSKSRLSEAEDQFDALKTQEGNLSQSIAELSTASGTETVMRTDFRIVKPGESLAVIIDSAASATATTTHMTFWQRAGEWFGNVF